MSDLDRLLAIRRLMANYRAPATGVLPSATAQDRRPQAYREGAGKPTALAEGLSAFMGQQPRYSVMDPQSDEFRRAREIGEQASVAAEFYGALSPFAAASTMASAQRAGSLLSPLTVFHGSPHKFSKFDASKIGTGEGAQAYGHGLYFAENPKVAQDYADVLASPRNMVSDKRGVYIEPSPVTSGKYMLATKSEVGQPYGVAGDATQFIYSDNEFSNIASAIKFAKRQGLLSKNDRPRLTAIGEDRKYIPVTKASDVENPEYTQFIASDSGSIYTVDLPDEQIAKMVNWDVSINKQSDPIKQVLLPLAQKYGVAKTADVGTLLGWMQREMPASEVSNKLREAGIPGIRYLDQGSRGNYQAQTTYKGKPYGDVVSFATQKQLDDYVAEKTAEGFGVNRIPQSSNFVVFPGEESKLRIMEVNGKPVVINEDEFLQGLLGL